MWSGLSPPLVSRVPGVGSTPSVSREGPPPEHAVKVKGLEGLDAPLKQRGHTDRAKCDEVEGVPPLGKEVVVVGRHQAVAFVKRRSWLVKEGIGAGEGRRDRACDWAIVTEVLDGTHVKGLVCPRE